MTTVRPEKPEDVPLVHEINEQAFEQAVEADLVDKLRRNCSDIISLVAEEDNRPVGHILFTPVVIESGGGEVRGMGLGPMAVAPDHQRQGIGIELVNRGLELLRGRGCPFVIVLGHPEYYPRFGFAPAAGRGLRSQWDGVPDEAFMVLVLDEAALEGVSGVARYRKEFDEAV